MVFYFMPFGSMEKVLLVDKKFDVNASLPSHELATNLRLVTQMMFQAASGLLHLHATGIVHRDVATRNFLVDQYHHVTVCDFGLSRALPEGQYVGLEQGAILPLKWCAPEILLSGCFSTASDVYAFGILMMEIASRSDPYPSKSAREVAHEVAESKGSLRPTIPPDCPTEWARIMMDCWAQSPWDRPTMQDVCKRLNTFFLQFLTNDNNHLLYEPFGRGRLATISNANATSPAMRVTASHATQSGGMALASLVTRTAFREQAVDADEKKSTHQTPTTPNFDKHEYDRYIHSQ